MATTNQELKELIAAVTARGADVRTTQMEGAVPSVHILGLPGVGTFPMPVAAAVECMRGIIAPIGQLDLALA